MKRYAVTVNGVFRGLSFGKTKEVATALWVKIMKPLDTVELTELPEEVYL